jgi:hypothetical protein
MTTAAADYDAAVHALRTQALPAIVTYTEEGSAHGIAHFDQPRERIVVDVRNKRVISRTPASGDNDMQNVALLTKRIFDPACYAPAGERAVRANNHDAVAITLLAKPGCADEVEFSTIYADSSTLDLLGADSIETDEGVTVEVSVQYARIDGYILPSSISAHAYGHGWLFWVRERAEVTYSDYSFSEERRQAQQPL